MFPPVLARKYTIQWFLGISLSISPCFAREVNPPMIPALQELSYLCWAASDYMVFERYGVSTTHRQCDIVNRYLSANTCCSQSGVSVCNSLGQSNVKKEIYGLGAISKFGALDWNTIKNEIDNDRPFIFIWNFTGGGSHMMVGVGYHNTTESGIPTSWVDYNDPRWGRDQIRFAFFNSDPDHTSGQTHYRIQKR